MAISRIKRRQFLTGLAAGAAGAATVAGSFPGAAAPASRSVTQSTEGLAGLALRPLPLGTIRPEGWLGRQLRIQAEGLSGHLDEFWPDVAQSQWFGGQAEGWERAPYWLDGMIPLAWLLGDPDLKAKVKRRVDQIVAGQRADGWFAPYPRDIGARPYDQWAILLVNKVLVQYHEATGEDAVLEAVIGNLRALATSLDRVPLFNWGRFRWFEGLIPVYYAYERVGDGWLLDLARKLRDQGFDYGRWYEGADVTAPTPRRGRWTFEKHVVNTGMALKAGALWWRLARSESERALPARMLRILDRYHGQATGMFTGDECLSGRNPIQGTELCAVVETLYSLEWLAALTGDAAWGDRLEQLAFNALPATFAPDMWSHQYNQQLNQVQCTVNPDHMWSTNGPESNLYGLEPNYGCCTANMHQGWPKFAAHLWMRTPDEGLAVVAYAPSSLTLDVRGALVRVGLATDYPFREQLRLTVDVEGARRFPLVLRVPEWAEGATLRMGDGPERPLQPGTFHRVEREWRGSTVVGLRFPMRPRVVRGYHQSVAVTRGPLVYSLKLGEAWTRIHADRPHRDLPHADFEVRPTTPWNYGLALDTAEPEKSLTFEERPVGERPFSPEGAGMAARVKGRRMPGWRLEHGWAGELAPGPHTSNEPIEDLTLIPYGCTNIRVTEFPALAPPGV